MEITLFANLNVHHSHPLCYIPTAKQRAKNKISSTWPQCFFITQDVSHSSIAMALLFLMFTWQKECHPEKGKVKVIYDAWERERWVGFLFGLCPTKWFQSLDNSDIERILCLKMEVTSWCRIYSYKGASQSLLGHGGINSNNQFCLSVCFCTFIHFMCSFLNHFSIMFWTNVISCP